MSKPTGRPNGRPYISAYDHVAKTCEKCGGTFHLRDKQFQSYNRFMKRRFCSTDCAGSAPRESHVPAENFWPKVQKAGDDECWLWTGRLGHNGYGLFQTGGKYWRAHRYAYTLLKGQIPNGKMVLHSCDVRNCVNPNHLRTGTAKDNLEDAISRSRLPWQKREVA